jgi:hypothetical protein
MVSEKLDNLIRGMGAHVSDTADALNLVAATLGVLAKQATGKPLSTEEQAVLEDWSQDAGPEVPAGD